MMARRLSRVAARTASVETAAGEAAARSAIFAPTLASTAGHMPSRAESHSGRGPGALQAAAYAMMGRAAQTPGLVQVFSIFESATNGTFYGTADLSAGGCTGTTAPAGFKATGW